MNILVVKQEARDNRRRMGVATCKIVMETRRPIG